MLYCHQSTGECAGKEIRMGKRWGSNEDIHIGDIFCCYADSWPEYYQVTALRGRMQVILHAIRSETYINEGIAEGSSLYWRRERTRPLAGQLLPVDETIASVFWKCGKPVRVMQEEVTAWVLPCRSVEDRPQLQVMGVAGKRMHVTFTLGQPEDWEPWDAEMIRKLEEYAHQNNEVFIKRLKGGKEASWPEYPT